ncbi:AEC family transporter [Kitasatospora sp. YST-16]|uniref:AEC family transporter n=1 Tax=unclassified Kitasatospora TaxID=2633591 RepID=UPI00068953AE|nr:MULTISPECIES: AEC family transporter [unclassified Kitasatospora]WAL70720.1 AEC family transporter [Kitasatospora sp. YST-16]WNW36759.1 AEC family transporter [Streptomyces sp. Li-HN-5-13]
MEALVSAFAPIWALTAVGWLAGRTGLLGADAEAVLGRFVFHVSMPAALFTVVARTDLASFADRWVLAFAAGTLAASVLGLAAGLRAERSTAERTVAVMAAGYVNSGNLGIPVAAQVLGSASFAAPVLLFQVLLVTPVLLTVLDASTGTAPPSPAARLRRLAMLPLRNPVILGAGLGALFSAEGWHLPGPLAHSADLLGAAAVPAALVTLGLSLHTPPGTAAQRPDRGELGVAVLVKTVGQPLAALAVGALLLHLRGPQLRAAVLMSALPTAQNVYVYARLYGAAPVLARSAVLASTVLSMLTLSVIAWSLGGG